MNSIAKNPETLCKAEREGSFETNLKLGQVFPVSEDRNVHLAQGPTKDQANVFVFPEDKITCFFFRTPSDYYYKYFIATFQFVIHPVFLNYQLQPFQNCSSANFCTTGYVTVLMKV